MAQQTAMQKLWKWIDDNYHEENFNINDARDASLKMEKEQISQGYISGLIDGMNEQPKEYYNETYGKE